MKRELDGIYLIFDEVMHNYTTIDYCDRTRSPCLANVLAFSGRTSMEYINAYDTVCFFRGVLRVGLPLSSTKAILR